MHSPLLRDKVDYVAWRWRADNPLPYDLIPLVRDYELGLSSLGALRIYLECFWNLNTPFLTPSTHYILLDTRHSLISIGCDIFNRFCLKINIPNGLWRLFNKEQCKTFFNKRNVPVKKKYNMFEYLIWTA